MKIFSRGVSLSAIIGTPIHELSHYILCKLCSHKVLKVSLYNFGNDGTLGYVTHSFNKKNILSVAGNLPIGIAPLFGGCLAVYFINDILLPRIQINEILLNVSAQQLNGLTTISHCVLLTVGQLFSSLLTGLRQYDFWKIALWFYLSGSIALHMAPSKVDLSNSVTGLFITSLIFLVVYLFSPHLTFNFIIAALSTLTIILTIAIILASATLVITLIIEAAINSLRKIKAI